jgi:hypothetical protein
MPVSTVSLAAGDLDTKHGGKHLQVDWVMDFTMMSVRFIGAALVPECPPASP